MRLRYLLLCILHTQVIANVTPLPGMNENVFDWVVRDTLTDLRRNRNTAVSLQRAVK